MFSPLLSRKALIFLDVLRSAGCAVALFSSMAAGHAATALYQEEFTGPAAPLSSRPTAPGFSQWEAGPAVTTGDGLLTVDATKSGNETIRLQMPSLEGRELLRVRLRARSSGSASDSHISFGFVPNNTVNPVTDAALWVIDRSDSFALMYSAGPGNENQIVGESWYGDFPRDNSQETEHVIEYNLKTGRVTVSIENNGNRRTLASDVLVNWNGGAGQPIPLENLAFFAVSFYQQEPTEKGANAAYLKSLQLEVSDL